MININIFLYNSFDNNCIPALRILRCTLACALIEQWGRNSIGNISIDLLGVCSWHHPVVTSGCIFGLPGNARLSVNVNSMGHYHVLFKSAFHLCFLPSKPCFSQKSVPLNLCYTKANQQWIDSFPHDRCDRLIKSKTSFSSVLSHAVERESELRPK